MKIPKIVGAVFFSCLAFLSVGAKADAEPVACSWTVISSYGPPSNLYRNIVRQCRESNGDLVATQEFVGYSNGNTENCTLTTEENIFYTGDCIQPVAPSFFREVTPTPPPPPPEPTCQTPGQQVHGGFCANSSNPGMLDNPTYQARCGSHCSLEFQNLGYTSTCPYAGAARSPEYGIFCK